MWSDNETSVDYIDFQHYVEVIASIINNIDLLPCSIGVHGDWGSGKSSLMQMIEKRYEREHNYLIVKFNGWQFEGYEDAKTVLMGRIIEVIGEEKGALPKVKELASKLLNRIDLWKLSSSVIKIGVGLVTGPAGIAAITAKDVLLGAKDTHLGDVIKDSPDDGKSLRKSIHDFHKEFDELLAATSIERLIVLIDDLDRCLPDTVIGTLEAIKLFLFIPKTAFIIGADEQLIRNAVRKRFDIIPGEERELSREYLEKLIQFPIRIHQMNSNELETYINLLFSKIYLQAGTCEDLRVKVIVNKQKGTSSPPFNISNAKDLLGDSYSSMQETLLISQQITPVLVRGLKGNPRLCKRFLNTILMRQAMAKSKGIELKNSIFAKLMLLEYFKPEQFKTIYTSLQSNNGVSIFLSDLEIAIVNLNPKPSSDISILEIIDNGKPDQDLWLKDPWLLTWLRIEPKLRDEDLSQYFYFSRDKITAVNVFSGSLNTTLHEIYDSLISSSDILFKKVESNIIGLSGAEASGLFGSMTETIAAEEKIQEKKRLISRLFDFCNLRKELMSEFLTFIERVADLNIDSAMVIRFQELLQNPLYKVSAKKILNKWEKSTDNKQLSNLVKARMDKTS